jgi:hypothetical protein
MEKLNKAGVETTIWFHLYHFSWLLLLVLIYFTIGYKTTLAFFVLGFVYFYLKEL